MLLGLIPERDYFFTRLYFCSVFIVQCYLTCLEKNVGEKNLKYILKIRLFLTYYSTKS